MDMETAVSVMNALDEAERLLGQMRLHGGVGIGRDVLDRNRELLEQAHRCLDAAHVEG